MKFFMIFLFASAACAQDTSSASIWSKEAVAGFNISTADYTNWQAGGEDATNWTVKINSKIERDAAKHNWTNTGKAGYGMTSIGGDEYRKSMDEIYLETLYKFKLTKLLNPYAGALLETQFFNGYNYTDSGKQHISTFWDPGYLSQSAGMGLAPLKDLTTRLGFQLKETFSNTYGFADDDQTNNEIESFKIEPGLESVSDYSYTFNKIMKYETKLSVFVNFKGMENIDGKWTNQLSAQVAKYLNFNAGFEMLYDNDQSDTAQRRHNISVGLNYSLL